MKKLALTLVLAFAMSACTSQERFSTRFKNSNPKVINGQVTKCERNEFGSYTIYVVTKEYGKVAIHYVPSTAWLISIPVFIGDNGELHYRKT